MTSTSMNTLYNQLLTVGIPKKYAKKVLPEWWDDQIAATEAGLQQAQLYFSRAFNLDLNSLKDTGITPSFHNVEHKFKLNKNVSEFDVTVSAHYVTAMAKIALKAVAKPYQPIPKDPAALRAQLLENNEFVSLKVLLIYCAEIGIPVLHIKDVPGKKMTGLAIRVNNRFAIVLSKAVHPAYLLFHLAHELGHIAMEHLSKDGFIVDAKTTSTNDDADEKEADAYAIRLLNGSEKQYSANGSLGSPKNLHSAALQKANETNVDLGHIILNFAKNNNCFPLAAKALSYIPDSDCGSKMINDCLFNALDSTLLSDDQQQLLLTATDYS